MKVIDDLTDLKFDVQTVVTSGTFDGVHVGHQKILRNLANDALAANYKSVVATFWPHPRFVLAKEDNLKLLSTFEEKSALIANLGIDYLVKIPFTKEFSKLTSEQFIQNILVDKINTKRLVIGYDHKFGNNREGGFEYLKANEGKYGFTVEEIGRQDIEEVGVSSTKIRKALQSGDIAIASEYLGRNYSITGLVIGGSRIGREIGFPTANIEIQEKYKLVPADGTYAVWVDIRGVRHMGMLNIGMRPTVMGEDRRIEVNIFDFDTDIYNDELTIHFHSKLRLEQKFENLEQLKHQLAQDKIEAIKKLRNDQKV